MRTLVSEAAADETTINEIAESPAMWWGVQRQINEQKAAKSSPWPPVGKILRWFMIGAPVAAAAVLAISLFLFSPVPTTDRVAVLTPVASTSENAPQQLTLGLQPEQLTRTKETSILPRQPVISPTKQAKRFALSARLRPAEGRPVVKATEMASRADKKEIKTDFIALSYARNPESGQIVRVKVPSSMMVSLGLVASVKKPSDLVEAEVLVGDDGLTRAIRFIR